MSSIKDSCSYKDKDDEKCTKSPDGKHDYYLTNGMWPSCEFICKYCKDIYYTK